MFQRDSFCVINDEEKIHRMSVFEGLSNILNFFETLKWTRFFVLI